MENPNQRGTKEFFYLDDLHVRRQTGRRGDEARIATTVALDGVAGRPSTAQTVL